MQLCARHFPIDHRRPSAHRVLDALRGCCFATMLCCLSNWTLPPQSSTAQETNNSHTSSGDLIARALSTRGTVTFRETPLSEVILILSEQWNLNIIAGADIGGQVNGTFKEESLKSILDSILLSNGLQYRQVGNSLVVLPNAEMGGNHSNFRVEVLDARVGSPEEMDELITALKLEMSADGQLVPISSTGKLTVLDTPERIAAVKALLAQIAPSASGPQLPVSTPAAGFSQSPGTTNALPAIDSSLPIAVELRPQFVLATDLQKPMEMIVGAANLSVVEQENLLVVLGDSAVQHKAQLLMQQLDKPRAQVRITGYIYDVDLSEIEKLGVDWAKKFNSTGVDANGVPNNMAYSGSGLLTPSEITNSANAVSGVVADSATSAATGAAGAAAATAAPGGQFLFSTLSSGAELQLLIQALEQTKGSRLLADPHVTVVDRHLASLGIVTQIPVQQLTQTQQGGSIGSTAFKDAGITLDVTPHISNDGTIEMQVAPTFSVVAGYQNGNPIIDTRRAETVVRVNHGQALVIGGLRSKTTVETVKGIPGLMDVKYLGALFRAHATDVRESELLVFIMPEIVGYCGGLPREMQALGVTQQQLSRVQTAVDGPFTPDCRDKHCPQHHERPRIHNGSYDCGLIGVHDVVFVAPAPAAFFPSGTDPATGAPYQSVVPNVTTDVQFEDSLPRAPETRVPETVVPRPLPSPVTDSNRSQLPTTASSRRILARPVGFQRSRGAP